MVAIWNAREINVHLAAILQAIAMFPRIASEIAEWTIQEKKKLTSWVSAKLAKADFMGCSAPGDAQKIVATVQRVCALAEVSATSAKKAFMAGCVINLVLKAAQIVSSPIA